MAEGPTFDRTWQTIDTEYNADSVEWCPVPGFQDLVLCGTYQLEEDTGTSQTASQAAQVRIGRLYVYKFTWTDDQRSLQEVTRVDMPGILDIKWSHQLLNDHPHFALVNSVGQIKVFLVENEKQTITMTMECRIDENCLGLSLEWNDTVTASGDPLITVSDSKGGVSVYKLTSAGLEKLSSWKAHDFEAWITAFNQWDTNTVFTGGDDCRFKVWDLRMEPGSPVLSSKRHSMGVTSIQSHPTQEFTLATGSYDEQLLLWDTRSLRRPVTETSLGGGIWRIKWKPVSGDYILSATMYNGFHVVKVTKGEDLPPSVVYNYTEHNSIAYGADWVQGGGKGPQVASSRGDNSGDLQSSSQDLTVATCSFYDHVLKLWNMQYVDTDK